MEILVSEPINGTHVWKTKDGKFTGVLIPAVILTADDSSEPTHLQAAALLAVPKHSMYEVPSINKYSPVIAQAEKVEDLNLSIEAWVKKNQGKKLWDLRTR